MSCAYKFYAKRYDEAACPPSNTPKTVAELIAYFASHGITLCIQKKSVKNLNFRLTQSTLKVSVPSDIDEQVLVDGIYAKIQWAIRSYHALMIEKLHYDTLWGERLDEANWLKIHQANLPCRTLEYLKKLPKQALIAWIYRYEIKQQLPSLLSQWQPKVGKKAAAIRLRQMSSRWGSCNTLSTKITLNTRLASYPLGCLAYVLVHELCHLHHANHSANFWKSVENAMPDYKYWHDLLKQSKR